MTPSMLGLLLGAAALHATWNVLLKRVDDRQVLVWGALCVSTAGFLPLLAIRPARPPIGWSLALASAALEAVYYMLLMSAYRVGDFSVVYPIARGAAPALLAVWSVLLLGERPRPGGVAGILLIVAGLITVGIGGAGSAWTPRALARPSRGSGLALLIALLISMYSIVDGLAVRRVDAVAYTIAMFALTTALLGPFVLWRFGRERVWRVMRARGGLVFGIGILQCVAYMTVLYVYARASIGYAGAIRECSIVLGALAGWWWLGEAFGARRAVGALVIFGGIACIAVAG